MIKTAFNEGIIISRQFIIKLNDIYGYVDLILYEIFKSGLTERYDPKNICLIIFVRSAPLSHFTLTYPISPYSPTYYSINIVVLSDQKTHEALHNYFTNH